MHALRRQIEALFWLGRPASMLGKAPPVLAGFLVGSPERQPVELGFITLFAVSMQLIISSLNDVYDAPRDSLTAPYLPIPSGLVTRGQAVLLPIAAGIILALTLVPLADDAGAVLLIGLTACVGVGIGSLYGRTKSSAWSPLLASTGSVGAALWGWILSDREELVLLILVAMAMVLHGVFMNLINQLRDIDKDPDAGNYTVGARKGWRVTLAWASTARVLECGALATLAAGSNASLRGLAAIAPLLPLAFGIRRAAGLQPQFRPGRLGSTSVLDPFRLSTLLAEIVLLFVLSPATALVIGSTMWLWYRLIRPLYDRRVVTGGLLRAANSHV